MFEVIPSQYMRDCYKKIDFAFTDFQKATLIWNAPGRKRKEILDALRELNGSTTDERTRIQIEERLHYEENAFTTFKDNSLKKYVYVVENQDDENVGFFSDYDMAEKYAIGYMQKYDVTCCIKKQRIVFTTKDEIVRNPWRGNPNMGIETEEYCAYSGAAVGRADLCKGGEVRYFYSYELPEEEKIVDTYKVERFEYSFIKMPFPLQMGLLVRNVVTGIYAILAQGEEEWNDYLKFIEERNLYVDFSDIQVVVFKLTETGIWSHEHVNPLYLEAENPLCITGDKKQRAFLYAMEVMGDYLSYKGREIDRGAEQVLRYSKKYAQVCHDDSWEKQFDNAEKPEDIMN